MYMLFCKLLHLEFKFISPIPIVGYCVESVQECLCVVRQLVLPVVEVSEEGIVLKLHTQQGEPVDLVGVPGTTPVANTHTHTLTHDIVTMTCLS